jgi:putative Mg2+ transporter-C (MgtC) family protein
MNSGLLASAWAVSAESQLMLALQALGAALLGALVGFERGRSGKDAGMRTHALVATASAIACGLGDMLISTMDQSGDATRTLHAVITGVGFIGAGAILHSDHGTTGVTTAASVLFVAVIGGCVGLGAPLLAVLGCAMALIVLRVLGRWQHLRQHKNDATHPHDLD